MAKIAIDCDEVLCDFYTGFFQVANTIWPGRFNPAYAPSGWNDFQGMTSKERHQVWDKVYAIENWWLSLGPHSEAVGALATFLATERDHDIYIVTARKSGAGMTVAKQTQIWLHSCGINQGQNYLGIIAVEDSPEKARLYQAMGVQYSIDDKGITVVECDALKDHKAYLLDRSWNQDVTVKRRVATLDQFLSSIKGDPK